MRALIAAVVAVLAIASGCISDPPDGDMPPTDPTTPTGGTSPPTTPPTDDGAGGDGALAFDEARALELARAQVIREDGSVRYRVPGTEGNAEAAALIAESLAEQGLAVRYHHFNATYGCEETPMHNVVGVLDGRSAEMLYVAAHYDSRPIAEKDPDPDRRDEPIQGAIDGAGATGVVLELARALAARAPLDVSVTFLFFDGEDGGGYLGRECTDWILGSRAFAEDMTEAEVEAAAGFVLLDLIGHADARFPQEGHSIFGVGAEQTRAIWTTASDLGYPRFEHEPAPYITDDHVPFVQKGIPATDVIDLRDDGSVFGAYHHTHDDNVDALDAGVMGEVGRTVEAWVLASFASA